MRKITVLVLSAIFFMFSLTGCGPSKEEKAFNVAKEAYNELCGTADLTKSVMGSVYGAWYFGIYKASDSTTSTVLSDFTKETNLTQKELEAAVKSLAESYGVSESTLHFILADKSKTIDISTWEYCLSVVDEAYKLNGVFDEIQGGINSANASLKIMTADYDDYKHYPVLKEFYSKVSSYAEFAQSPTGSFQQLSNTVADYENSIRTYRTDLSFVFD